MHPRSGHDQPSHCTMQSCGTAVACCDLVRTANPYAGKRCMSDHTTGPCDLSRIPPVSCVAPVFPQCLVDDSPVIRCGDSAASKNCTKMLQQQSIAVGSSEVVNAVLECVEEIAAEPDDEDTRADCYTEICSNVTVRISDTESISTVRSRCIQEFVLMSRMTRTAVGRLVNNFVQQCKQVDNKSLATDGAINN